MSSSSSGVRPLASSDFEVTFQHSDEWEESTMRLGFAATICASLLSIGLSGHAAMAQCIGSGAFSTCSDGSGNSYSVQRLGNSTFMNGTNAQTGSSWSQESHTFGGTTFHNGTAADGGRWNMTDQSIGSSRFISGSDSNGNGFSMVCNQFGCF